MQITVLRYKCIVIWFNKQAMSYGVGECASERLNTHWFMSLDDAREKMEDWRRDYNEVRPHSAIGYKPPIVFMNGLPATPPG